MAGNRPRTSRRISVWKKTGGVCAHCGRQASSREQTVDHYIPKSWGGGYDFNNLMPLCRDCNEQRGTERIDAYTFYKYAPLDAVRKCVKYGNEFQKKYRSMGDFE